MIKRRQRYFLPSGQRAASIAVVTWLVASCLCAFVAPLNAAESSNWSFRNHVQPVLAKAGCSSGACHGAAAGQGGFKFSLRGYDDEGDWKSITRSALGRRIVLSDPARSLLLLKPTGAVPHKGGTKFEVGSLEYKILAEWIAAGAPPPKADDARITKLEVSPEHATLKPGDAQQLTVKATFSDGAVQDVTRWAKFTDANASVTTVDESGNVKVAGFGEGAITAWFLSRIAIATITAPYTNKVAPDAFAKAPRRNFIDDEVIAKLRELNIPPSPRATDEVFIRRAFLDTIGVLPTAEEAREFANNKAADKRYHLIDSLLARPEFVDYWSYKWSDLLLVNSERLRPAAMWSYYNWIRNNVAANTPWDRFVRDLVTARGSTLENGAANFYALHEDPPNMAETTSQAFLGMSINCAKCHNHPMEKWTNDEYFGFANLFARVRSKTGSGDGEKIIFAASEGNINQPLTGRPQKPKPLDGHALSIDDPNDRRAALADWLTSRDNTYFARAIVNRVWANFYGVGIVEKVDDLRITNPASNEKLLSAAANHLADQKFDLKALMRAILQSETYQRSSVALPENAADQRFYSRYYPKRLMAEVLLDAYSQVTAVPTEFRLDLRNQNRGIGEKYPAGLRALQLPDTRAFNYFLDTFGRPDRVKTCECERTAEPSMSQALHIANGDTVNKKLAAKDSIVARLLGADLSDEKLIDEASLTSLSRLPTPAEKKRFLKALAGTKDGERRAALEDIFWAMLSSREFLFNH
ncbi:MAG: DUF1553 domain-containing protein [Verrucomicrobia bacterium]|nr:DUF1553 domain-containing protein [Verrucomicrobiota bacterium]